MTSSEQPSLLDMLIRVPHLMSAVHNSWAPDQFARELIKDGIQSQGLGNLRLVCKRASTDLLQAVCGLRLVLTTDKNQFKNLWRIAQRLQCSRLKRLHVHIVYPWGFPKSSLFWDPLLTYQLRECISALGPALSTVTSLQLTTDIEMSPMLYLLSVIMYLFLALAWSLAQLCFSQKLWCIEACLKPSNSYLQQLVQACPRVRQLSVDGCLVWSVGGLCVLGQSFPELVALQIVEQELHPYELGIKFPTFQEDGDMLAMLFRPLIHGRSNVLATLPGSPALAHFIRHTMSDPVTDKGSPERTHAILCNSSFHLRQVIEGGQVASCRLEGWKDLPSSLQTLSFAAPTHMLPYAMQSAYLRNAHIDITCWMFGCRCAHSVEVHPIQLMAIRSQESAGSWLCARHPCPHVYRCED